MRLGGLLAVAGVVLLPTLLVLLPTGLGAVLLPTGLGAVLLPTGLATFLFLPGAGLILFLDLLRPEPVVA